MVNSLFNKDPKNIIFSGEALISGKGWQENLEKMSNNKDIYCYADLGVDNFEREYSLYPLVPNPCDASIFLHARPNLRKKK